MLSVQHLAIMVDEDAVLARGDDGQSGPQPGRDEGERQRAEMERNIARAALPTGRNFH